MECYTYKSNEADCRAKYIMQHFKEGRHNIHNAPFFFLKSTMIQFDILYQQSIDGS